MDKHTRWVGLDVHAETIAVAIADEDGSVQSVGTIPNEGDAIRRAMKKLGRPERVRVCYEAGPCGYGVYWQLSQLGIACEVIAPTLVPVRAGDRVKTDRRDAMKLASLYRSGTLTPVWVPDAAHEALRDLVRAREAACKDLLRARHRLSKFLLRAGRKRPVGVRAWTVAHLNWLSAQRWDRYAQEATFIDYLSEVKSQKERVTRLEAAIDVAVAEAPKAMQEVIGALQALRGVAPITAITVVTEVGTMRRFNKPSALMAYVGVVPREHSSGPRTRRGAITKTGNAHLRRVLGEAAWSYRHKPAMYPGLRRRSAELSEEVRAIAWKAQHRLHNKYYRLTFRGKTQAQVATAVSRELLGFMWAIGVAVESTAPMA